MKLDTIMDQYSGMVLCELVGFDKELQLQFTTSEGDSSAFYIMELQSLSGERNVQRLAIQFELNSNWFPKQILAQILACRKQPLDYSSC